MNEASHLLTAEAEWLTCPELGPMLLLLRDRPGARTPRRGGRTRVAPGGPMVPAGKALARKWRLFAVACCRRVWDALTDERSRRAVEVAERHADGRATDDKLSQAWRAAWDACLDIPAPQDPGTRAAAEAARACTWPEPDITDEEAGKAASFAAFATTALPVRTMGAERAAQCDLLRDLFNPFRPVAVDPVWLAWDGGTISRIAQVIYEERHFEQLPILADALEDAGCSDQNLLAHCRGPGEHARGCWAVDLLLSRE